MKIWKRKMSKQKVSYINSVVRASKFLTHFIEDSIARKPQIDLQQSQTSD